MKKVLFFFFSLMLGATLYAQEVVVEPSCEPVPDGKESVEPDSCEAVVDSVAAPSVRLWFVDGGIGANAMYDAGHVGGWGFGSELAVGRFIFPEVAVRLAVQLGSGAPVGNDSSWLLGGTYFRSSVALDVMWNVIDTFVKDASKCSYRALPYIRLGGLFGSVSSVVATSKAASLCYGAGLRHSYKLNDVIDLVVDMNAVITDETPWRGSAGHLIFGQMTAGASYKF